MQDLKKVFRLKIDAQKALSRFVSYHDMRSDSLGHGRQDYSREVKSLTAALEGNNQSIKTVKDKMNFYLGMCYRWGVPGVAKDYPLAIKYLIKASQGSNAEFRDKAHCRLGEDYYLGLPGIEKDLEKSINHLKKVNVEYAGRAAADFYLGKCYFFGGQGIKKETARAVYHFKKVIKTGGYFRHKDKANAYMSQAYYFGSYNI